MMTMHLCLSTQIKHLRRWRQAFPNGHIADSAKEFSATGPPTLLWLHSIDPDESRIDKSIFAIRAILPETKIVVISNTPSQQEALLALNSGAAGYCHAQASPSFLQQVATVVTNGGLWIGSELMSRILAATEQLQTSEPNHLTLAQLTPREQEVALAVGRGISNKEVAQELAITERTVKAHLGSIFEKLEVRDRLQLAILLSRDTLPEDPTQSHTYSAFPG